MPRPHRKRGRGNKPKKEDEDEEAPQQAPSHPAVQPIDDVMEELEAVEAGPSQTSAQVSPSAPFPDLDPDSKAYWKGIDEKVRELEGLGIGRRKRGREEEEPEADEGDEDERRLLLRSALGELSGHELALAADPETSIILERLLHSMDDFGKRVLMDRFAGQIAELSIHRHASHALQTLFALSSGTLEREAKGVVAKQPDGATGELLSMSELMVSACQELAPQVEELARHPAASHILSLTLFITLGQPLPDDGFRSRKSQRFRNRIAPMRGMDVSPNEDLAPSVVEKGKGRVASAVQQAGNSLLDGLRTVWAVDGGDPARKAATTADTAQLVQTVVTLEHVRGDAEEATSVTSCILDGLLSSKERKRSDFVETCLRDATSSHLFELIASRSSDGAFKRLYDVYFRDRLVKLSSHPVANFVTAKAISRLPPEAFASAVAELVDGDHLASLVDSGRTGPIQSLVSRAASLKSREAEAFSGVMQAFDVAGDDKTRFAFPCVLSLMRLDHFRKTKAYSYLVDPTGQPAPSKLPETSIQGSLLLQSLLCLAPSVVSPFLDSSFHTLPLHFLVAYAHDPSASRVLDLVVSSPSVPSRHRRRLVLSLIPSLPLVADDRIGSRFAERCWEEADGYLKEKIAEGLVGKEDELQRSMWGHHLARKVKVPLFERRRDEWRLKVAKPAPTTAPPTLAVEATEQAQKKDAVDEIFDAVAPSKRKRKGGSDAPFGGVGGEGHRAAKARRSGKPAGRADEDKVTAAAADVLGQKGMADLLRGLKSRR